MTNHTLIPVAGDDIELVAQSVAGSQEAFGRIVERYQSLVCALAFSSTGSVTRSEDLAQEIFLVAWQQLRALREPAKLRSWLCGIARNTINADVRRQGREPIHRAEPLADADELPAPEALPLAQVISDEEVALLWREVGRLPEIYRETLILYYREQQSVARVAAALELGEDAVMQRLSRGRKLLHERMLVFVETALDRTRPGRHFVLGVQAALPLLAVGGQGAGLASVKGVAVKGGGFFGLLPLAMPFIGMLAALGVSWSSIRQAPNPAERRFTKIWNIVLWSSIGALLLGIRGVDALAETQHWELQTALHVNVGLWTCYLVILTTLLVLLYRRGATRFGRQADAGQTVQPVKNPTAIIIGSYVASTGWIIGLAWLMGDGGVAALLLVMTIGLAAWNLRRLRLLSLVAGHRLNMGFHAALCGVLLLVVNLRVDHWMAPLYRVSAEEMHRLLPMTTIHVITILLVGWAAVLLVATGRKQAATTC